MSQEKQINNNTIDQQRQNVMANETANIKTDLVTIKVERDVDGSDDPRNSPDKDQECSPESKLQTCNENPELCLKEHIECTPSFDVNITKEKQTIEECILKRRAKKSASYTSESLQQALKEIREGRMPIRVAARIFGVPRCTLQDRLRNHRLRSMNS